MLISQGDNGQKSGRRRGGGGGGGGEGGVLKQFKFLEKKAKRNPG